MRSRLVLRSILEERLAKFESERGVLPGIHSKASRDVFLEQLVDSVRRVEFVKACARRDVSEHRAEPDSESFDPVLASIYRIRNGDLDDACWLIFLAIHTGKHRAEAWRLASLLYGGADPEYPWTWNRVSAGVTEFRTWLDAQSKIWRASDAPPKFGNHRRYESLSGSSPAGTGAIIESYVSWVTNFGGHAGLLSEAAKSGAGDVGLAFNFLYRSMTHVHRFGRLARFDFLCMLSKIGAANIEPATPYLASSTGPLRGAKLMMGDNATEVLDAQMVALGEALQVNMQVMEDALCNWQKSPKAYVHFRG